MYSTLWQGYSGRFKTKVILGIKLSSVNPGFLQLPWHEPTSNKEPVDLVIILT